MAILAYQYPVFKPAMRIVTNITNANPAIVTTSFPHGYISGATVRIDMPPSFGMQQINQQFGVIVVTSPTTFALPIDTTHYDAFSTPSTYPDNAQSCMCVPFAEDNSVLTSAVQNVLPY